MSAPVLPYLSEVKSLYEAPSEDIVDLLKRHGYGVVEGAEAVRKKIDELGRKRDV